MVMEWVFMLIAIPASYFLTLMLAGAIIEMSDAWKVCISVVIALLVFVAITAP